MRLPPVSRYCFSFSRPIITFGLDAIYLCANYLYVPHVHIWILKSSDYCMPHMFFFHFFAINLQILRNVCQNIWRSACPSQFPTCKYLIPFLLHYVLQVSCVYIAFCLHIMYIYVYCILYFTVLYYLFHEYCCIFHPSCHNILLHPLIIVHSSVRYKFKSFIC